MQAYRHLEQSYQVMLRHEREHHQKAGYYEYVMKWRNDVVYRPNERFDPAWLSSLPCNTIAFSNKVYYTTYVPVSYLVQTPSITDAACFKCLKSLRSSFEFEIALKFIVGALACMYLRPLSPTTLRGCARSLSLSLSLSHTSQIDDEDEEEGDAQLSVLPRVVTLSLFSLCLSFSLSPSLPMSLSIN